MRVKVTVSGLNELTRALKRADKRLPREMRLALNDMVEEVAQETRSRVPVRSGALRASTKPRSTTKEGRVVMGTPWNVPYAGWIEFGGNKPRPRPFKKEGRYLFPAAEEMAGSIDRRMGRFIDHWTRKAGLD